MIKLVWVTQLHFLGTVSVMLFIYLMSKRFALIIKKDRLLSITGVLLFCGLFLSSNLIGTVTSEWFYVLYLFLFNLLFLGPIFLMGSILCLLGSVAVLIHNEYTIAEKAAFPLWGLINFTFLCWFYTVAMKVWY